MEQRWVSVAWIGMFVAYALAAVPLLVLAAASLL
jgi:hypothetical protein